jgi:methylamine utilization protein MauE
MHGIATLSVLTPYFDLLVRAAAGAILGAGGFAKLAMPGSERRLWLASYALLPSRWVPVTSAAIPIAELALGAALISGALSPAPALAGAALLLVVTSAVVVTIARGKRPECGCFGRLSRELISVSIVWRNVALTVLLIGDALLTSRFGIRLRMDAPQAGVLIALAIVLSFWIARRRSTNVLSQATS